MEARVLLLDKSSKFKDIPDIIHPPFFDIEPILSDTVVHGDIFLRKQSYLVNKFAGLFLEENWLFFLILTIP